MIVSRVISKKFRKWHGEDTESGQNIQYNLIITNIGRAVKLLVLTEVTTIKIHFSGKKKKKYFSLR